jgi:predicted O-methyltransferase YrrM
MANFFSYVPLLCKYLRVVQPKRILEWGMGESTKIMHQVCLDAEIYTVEHNPEFVNEYRYLSGLSDKIHLYYCPIDKGYTSFPLIIGGKFDLVFVDGLDTTRPECLNVAFDVLSEVAVVILHDSERLEYRQAIGRYNILEENDGTVVLQK